jgi:hypothetical protein
MSGLPDKSTLSTYGGVLVNARPVENGATDQSASAGNQAMADCAGMTRTSTRAWARFTTAATLGALVLNSWDAVYGEVVSNAAPTFIKGSTGLFSVVFPSTITDALSVVHPLNFQRCGVMVEGSTLFLAQAGFVANAVTVAVWTTGFALTDAVGTVIHVWAC